MTKAKISEYDAVAANNTDVNGVNIAENCPPSGMNNMGREIMAALKRFQTGSDGDGVTVGGNLVVSGTSTLSTTSISSADINAGTIDGTAIGGSTPAAGSFTTLNTSGQVVFNDAGADVDFRVEGDTNANLLFVDASADAIGIGTSTPKLNGNIGTFLSVVGTNANGWLEVGTTSSTDELGGALTFNNTNIAGSDKRTGFISSARAGADNTANLIFGTNNAGTLAERMRITSGGLLKVVNSGSAIESSAGGVNEINTAANDTNTVFRNTAASLTGSRAGIDVVYTAAAPNGTTSNFYNASDTGAKRFEVRSNGGIGNYSANDVNLSDRREKTNFAPAKNYLNTICAIPIQTFNYVDQNLEDDDGLTLGVVAQDVQEVAPELVMESNWGTEEEPKMRLSIYQTDLQYALMKCIQELSAKNDALEARIAALEGQ
jgi:trimeric autotransporter adhesin